SSALAGPLFTVVASVSGFATQTNLSNGLSTEEVGRYSYVGGLTAGPSRSWFIDWDVLGDDTTAVPAATFVTNGFTITNAGTTSRTFDITVSLATPLTNPGQLSCFGNLSGTLTSDNGSLATVTALSPALWQGQVNGVTKLTLNPTVPNTMTTTVFGPVSGTWTGAVPGGPNVQTVGYQMKFTLSANSTVQFSGLWSGTAAVPAPGACTMILAAAGLGSTRRRRNMT
ncbi:MAG: hypothetical protein ACKPEA_04650, partial [Planctomycetota bacterium]